MAREKDKSRLAQKSTPDNKCKRQSNNLEKISKFTIGIDKLKRYSIPGREWMFLGWQWGNRNLKKSGQGE